MRSERWGEWGRGSHERRQMGQLVSCASEASRRGPSASNARERHDGRHTRRGLDVGASGKRAFDGTGSDMTSANAKTLAIFGAGRRDFPIVSLDEVGSPVTKRDRSEVVAPPLPIQ